MALKKSFARVLVAGAFVSVAALVAVPGVSQAKPKAKTPAPVSYYLSLGDSYSVGYQPVPGGATTGYTGYVAKKLKMTLENYGCGGATTESILSFTGVCGAPDSYGPPAATDRGTIPAGQSQVTAADNFITAHHGQIGLITVSIGGNDVTSCATAANAITCVAGVVTSIQTNVTSLVNQLESHLGAGNTTPIIGLTYPDVILGDYVTTPPNVSLANLSTTAFSALINPALKTAYTTGYSHNKFADLTTTAPFTLKLTPTKKYGKDGTVPVAVIEVCKLTWYCSTQAPMNIHANTKGYKIEGKLIVSTFKG
jgi:lysophospholipase L1-like esterase